MGSREDAKTTAEQLAGPREHNTVRLRLTVKRNGG